MGMLDKISAMLISKLTRRKNLLKYIEIIASLYTNDAINSMQKT